MSPLSQRGVAAFCWFTCIQAILSFKAICSVAQFPNLQYCPTTQEARVTGIWWHSSSHCCRFLTWQQTRFQCAITSDGQIANPEPAWGISKLSCCLEPLGQNRALKCAWLISRSTDTNILYWKFLVKLRLILNLIQIYLHIGSKRNI